MAIRMELLKSCDLVLVGNKYGISAKMRKEVIAAINIGIKVIREDELKSYMECETKRIEVAAWDYARACACCFCKGSRLHSCTGYSCMEAYKKAYEYAKKNEKLL